MSVNALAGAGKTTTLEMMTRAHRRRTLLMAYNRAIIEDAKGRFPDHVHCKTAHQVAFKAVGHMFADRLEGSRNGRLTPYRVSSVLPRCDIGGLSTRTIASMVCMTLTNWFNSADNEVSDEHVPQTALKRHGKPRNWIPADYALAVSQVVDATSALWLDLQMTSCELPFPHDGYLKLFSLAAPQLDYDSILIDEAQDTNPPILQLMRHQTCQQVLVGDQFQQLYAWRAAVNSLARVKADTVCFLTESFRFGTNIAAAANVVLETLGASVKVTGRGGQGKDGSRAILSRTNGALISELMGRTLNDHKRVHVVGGTEAPRRLIEALQKLKEGQPSYHGDLIGFQDYSEFAEAAEDEGAPPDLRMLHNLMEEFPVTLLLSALRAAEHVSAKQADVTVSTVHKSKGLEWDQVGLADDFIGPIDDKFTDAEGNVAYVAVTRARERLYGCRAMLKEYQLVNRARGAQNQGMG